MIFIILLIVVVGTISPIFTIWALNHIFHLELMVDLPTYLAVMWLQTVLYAASTGTKDT